MATYYGRNSDVLGEVLRPIGTWRFLTKIDTLQEGDLYRYIDDAMLNVSSTYAREWTHIPKAMHNTLVVDLDGNDRAQFIRPVIGTTVPLFDQREAD